MPVGAVIGAGAISGGASLASGIIGANAASDAADQQAQSAAQALATQTAAGNRAATTLAPYVDIGTGASHQLADLYGIGYAAQGTGQATTDENGVVTPANLNAATGSAGGQGVADQALSNFTKTPDYQFAFDQGLQGMQRAAAAGGTLISGGQLKAGQEFGEGLASQQFGNYFNRLLSLSQMGQGAASGSAGNSITSGNSMANTQQAIGQAQAAGTVGSANALGAGLSGVGSAVQNSLLLSKLPNLGGTSNPTPQGTASPGSLSAYTNTAPGVGLNAYL